MQGKSKGKVPEKHMPEKHHFAQGYYYIDMNEIPLAPRYKNEFAIWIVGQTVPLVDGCVGAVYAHDYERWYLMRFAGEKTYWD